MSRVATVVRSVVALYRERDIPFPAGSVAYSAFVSLIPLVLLSLIATSVFGGEAFRQYVLDVARQYLAPDTAGVVKQSITQAADRVGFSLLGFVALLWSVLKVFRTLDKAFSELYQASIGTGLGEQIRDGAIGGVILLLTWLYFGAVVVLLGGATNVVLAGRERALTGLLPTLHRPMSERPIRRLTAVRSGRQLPPARTAGWPGRRR